MFLWHLNCHLWKRGFVTLFCTKIVKISSGGWRWVNLPGGWRGGNQTFLENNSWFVLLKIWHIWAYYSFLFIFPRLSDQQFYLFTPECCWKSEIDISYFFPIFFLFFWISSYFSYFLPIFCFLGFLFPIFCSYFFSKIHETLWSDLT